MVNFGPEFNYLILRSQKLKNQKIFTGNIQTFKIYKFKLKFKLWNVSTHQNSTWNFCTPANAVSSCENWHFVSHRPSIFHKNSSKFNLKFLHPCKRCFLLWKLTFSVASSPLFLNIKWEPLKKLYPADAVFFFENRHFLTHRPPANPSLRFDDFARAAGKFFNV